MYGSGKVYKRDLKRIQESETRGTSELYRRSGRIFFIRLYKVCGAEIKA